MNADKGQIRANNFRKKNLGNSRSENKYFWNFKICKICSKYCLPECPSIATVNGANVKQNVDCMQNVKI